MAFIFTKIPTCLGMAPKFRRLRLARAPEFPKLWCCSCPIQCLVENLAQSGLVEMGELCWHLISRKSQLALAWRPSLKDSELGRAPEFPKLWCCSCPTQCLVENLASSGLVAMGELCWRPISQKSKLVLAWIPSFKDSELVRAPEFPKLWSCSCPTQCLFENLA